MQELVSDLKVIEQTGSCVGHFIKNLRANVSQFDPSEYAEKLVILYLSISFSPAMPNFVNIAYDLG